MQSMLKSFIPQAGMGVWPGYPRPTGAPLLETFSGLVEIFAWGTEHLGSSVASGTTWLGQESCDWLGVEVGDIGEAPHLFPFPLSSSQVHLCPTPLPVCNATCSSTRRESPPVRTNKGTLLHFPLSDFPEVTQG